MMQSFFQFVMVIHGNYNAIMYAAKDRWTLFQTRDVQLISI